MSKKIEFVEYGGPDVLRLVDEARGDAGPGQVRVRNELIGVNPIDWKMTAGHFGASLALPATPG
ncbi:NADPH:quinone reductase-like Zn-dependent oxidoreductase [Leucobacter exalbidus]|uniref:NADPH:quinone reductase-like Zn-dependent oxidoreductase n=1 Tax=Leucobacter exalbidus TaxID=662960 RepID=A0A940T5N8_9MICO|nr:hypothetical protein [Leucobacter exalbidus]MBP1326176.1 NADPH:quinone reductase-like Zn-dependent oxidoreductase [Leucobacter exalbidus]